MNNKTTMPNIRIVTHAGSGYGLTLTTPLETFEYLYHNPYELIAGIAYHVNYEQEEYTGLEELVQIVTDNKAFAEHFNNLNAKSKHTIDKLKKEIKELKQEIKELKKNKS